MNTLETVWRVHPLEVIAGGVIAVLCGLLLALWAYAFIEKEMGGDDFDDAD